jgi:Tol biopolymer transport system component
VSLHRGDLYTGVEGVVGTCAGGLASLRWAPRGDHLAFTDERALWVVPAAGGKPAQVGPPADYVRSLAWEPGGDALICDASWPGGSNDLWRVRLAGGAPEPLMAGGGGTYHPDVSPDGRSLLHVAEHKVRQLWVVRGDGSDPRPLQAPTTIECVAWSPDRSRVAFDDWEPRPGESSLVLVEMEGGEQRQLGWGICPTFSADGRALAFLGGVDRALWTLDLASGQRRRVLADAGVPGFVEANHRRRVAWSPDGTLVAYPTRGRPVDGLATVERRTGNERLLVAGEFGGAAWSPDGRWIATEGVEGDRSGVYLVEAASGRGRWLSPARSYNAAPTWAPDSRSLFVLLDETRRPRLRQIGLDGRELGEIELGRPDDPSFWGIFDVTGDPRHGWLYLLERYEGDLFLLAPSR